MPLNIISSRRVTGMVGTTGPGGPHGSSEDRDGGNGTDGAAGRSSRLTLTGITYQGDAGGDVIRQEWVAEGGGGGWGGTGGNGADAQYIVSRISGPSSILQNVVYDTPGRGGTGGRGGAGGAAAVRFGSLTVDLAGGLTAQNWIRLSGQARGGSGGPASRGGPGGNSSWTGTLETSTSTSSPNSSQIYSQQGTPGGEAPSGASGGEGSSASVSFTDIQVSGEFVAIDLIGTATGGMGGIGSDGSRGGSGSTGQPGGQGGKGGDAGRALAEVDRLGVKVTRGLTLTIQLSATGQAAGWAGAGKQGGYGVITNSTRINGVGSALTTTTHAPAGSGGNGGNGGSATARLVDSTIIGSEQADQLRLDLRARGGLGGSGGRGGDAVASQTITDGGSEFFTRSITVGAPAGGRGTDGITGLATVEVSANSIALGDGNDSLILWLFASSESFQSSRSIVRMMGNSFDGGPGRDTLVLGGGSADERAATIDVDKGSLRIGSAHTNILTGFEVFTATSAADRILDGVGNQEYRGGNGSDRFTFTAGLAGNDVIGDCSGSDRIVLSGFGSALDSFADVLAATTQTPGGALISTGGSSSILLAGFARASLTPALFSYL